MKRILGFLTVLLFSACLAHAQGKVSVLVSGGSRGSVPALELNGITYVDVQKTARKIGAGVEVFAQAKQAKVTARGFYAILTASLREVIVNAGQQKLEAPVVVHGGVIMAPVSFFTLPALQKSLQKEISFSSGTLYVERPFDLERTENIVTREENTFVFKTRRPGVTWKINQPNNHSLEVVFPGATFKRDEHFRFRTDFIQSADLHQDRNQAVLKIVLGKHAKDWSLKKEGNMLRLRVAEKPAAVPAKAGPSASAEKAPAVAVATSQLAQETAEGAEVDVPSVLAENPAVAQELLLSPGAVLDDKDDFEEMFPAAGNAPVLKADPEPAVSSTPVMKEGPETPSATPVMSAAPATPSSMPVMKAEPQPLSISAQKRKIRIVVDPGHGGKDGGAVRGKYREKEWNLQVANELVRLLKKGGFDVLATRSTDTFIALGERAKISNNFKADLFVSIHTNATKDKNANGFQVYFRSEKATDKEAAETAALENEAMQYEEAHYNFVDALLQSMVKNEFINESSKLAGYVRNAVYKQPGIGIAVNQNNSVRQANFYVLKGVQCPSILVEMGFISSQKDRARLASKSSRDKMAQGIYNGIVSYTKKEVKK